VGNTAQEVVREVRRQFAERPGIMAGEEKPDYARCVSIVAEASLKAMIKPGLLAVIGPVAVGVTFKLVGLATAQELLGAKAMAGLLMLSTITGILMALFFNTAGGAWDNSKKYEPARTFYLSIRLIHVNTGTSKAVRMVGKDPIRTKQPSLATR
jgi:inorganic pyrophosphatase